jgi:hypothetical protein
LRSGIWPLLAALLAGGCLAGDRPVTGRAEDPASARPATAEGRTERGAGFVAGPIGGIGFGYRRFDASGWGWQVGGLFSSSVSDRTLILGGQRMKTLRVQPRSRFYALAGAMACLSREDRDEFQAAGGFVRRRVDESSLNVGAGLGISFGSSNGATIAFELPLVFEFQNGLDSVCPIPQVSLVYNF